MVLIGFRTMLHSAPVMLSLRKRRMQTPMMTARTIEESVTYRVICGFFFVMMSM